MGRIWTDENRYRTWLEVEISICDAQASLGIIPKRAAEEISKRARFDKARIQELERVTRHDVLAFVQCVAESVGEWGRYLHLGVTSSDILDTSMAVLLRNASDIILAGLKRLGERLRELALEHKETVMIGRTHGVHAEPITFGLKLLLWFEENKRNISRMEHARETIRHGKISGAVGTYANIDPRVEEYVCRRLGLIPASISNQIIQRDRYAQYFTTLAILASCIERYALEIRHLQRTEVREVEEGFFEGQKGSSAMPHKRNPIVSENLCGLARIVRANAMASLENIALWHERDISHSSVERVIAPDSTILVDTMIHRFCSILDNMVVYPQAMRQNLEKTCGLIHSEAVMLLLINKGLSRQRAYELVQRNAMAVWREGGAFLERLLEDPEVMKSLTADEVKGCFDLGRDLRHVDMIYERVLGGT
jgi:adenylosuccinate lyase